MSDSATLLNLAKRCEAATGPDREIDRDVMETLIASGAMKFRVSQTRFLVTASLDYAMLLVPKTYHVAKLCEGEDDNPVRHRRQYTGRWYVRLHTTRTGVLYNLNYGEAATPALALCAAALRARANLS